MERFSEEQPIDLREYLAVLRARKWTIILVTALVVGSALFFSYRQTPLYQASARLLVTGVPTDASGFIPPPNLLTEAEIVTSEPVATLVIDDLELDVSTNDLSRDLTVEPAQETALVLQITYTSPDRDTAAEVPNSFAESYIEHKRAQATEALDAGRQVIQDRISSVQQRLTEIAREIDSREVAGDSTLQTTLETERSTLIARLGVLQQQLDDFQSRQPIDLAGGQLIDPAAQPAAPSSPDHVRNGALALFLGLALGVGLAFLRERLDDSFKGRPDLTRSLNVPVLATVPKVAKPRRKKERTLAVQVDPRGHAAEAYKSLRTSVQFLSEDRAFKSLLITSPSTGEGKTVTAGNLALALAQGGTRVILVSADLRRPTLELYFGIDNAVGLSNWLSSTNEQDALEIIRDPGIANLRVIPSGSIPPNPAELLSSRRFGTLMETLETQADLVLVDSPPVFPVTDPLVLVSRIGAAVLVVDAEKTRRSAAVHAKEELERVGGNVIGSIYNSFDPSTAAYGRYGGYYEYRGYSAPSASDPVREVVGDGEPAKQRRARSLFGSRR